MALFDIGAFEVPKIHPIHLGNTNTISNITVVAIPPDTPIAPQEFINTDSYQSSNLVINTGYPWSLYDNNPVGSTVTQEYDEDKQINVTKLTPAGGTNNGFISGWFNATSGYNVVKDIHKIEVKFDGSVNYVNYIRVQSSNTNNPLQYIYFNDTNTPPTLNAAGSYLSVGYRAYSGQPSPVAGEWYTIEADIDQIFKDLFPTETVTINGSLLRLASAARVTEVEMYDRDVPFNTRPSITSNYEVLPNDEVNASIINQHQIDSEIEVLPQDVNNVTTIPTHEVNALIELSVLNTVSTSVINQHQIDSVVVIEPVLSNTSIVNQHQIDSQIEVLVGEVINTSITNQHQVDSLTIIYPDSLTGVAIINQAQIDSDIELTPNFTNTTVISTHLIQSNIVVSVGQTTNTSDINQQQIDSVADITISEVLNTSIISNHSISSLAELLPNTLTTTPLFYNNLIEANSVIEVGDLTNTSLVNTQSILSVLETLPLHISNSSLINNHLIESTAILLPNSTVNGSQIENHSIENNNVINPNSLNNNSNVEELLITPSGLTVIVEEVTNSEVFYVSTILLDGPDLTVNIFNNTSIIHGASVADQYYIEPETYIQISTIHDAEVQLLKKFISGSRFYNQSSFFKSEITNVSDITILNTCVNNESFYSCSIIQGTELDSLHMSNASTVFMAEVNHVIDLAVEVINNSSVIETHIVSNNIELLPQNLINESVMWVYYQGEIIEFDLYINQQLETNLYINQEINLEVINEM